MASTDSLLVEAKQYTPLAPDLIIQRELRNAASEFFRKTFIWRQTLVFETQGLSVLDPNLPTGTQINRIETIVSNKRKFRGVDFLGLAENEGNPVYLLDGDSIVLGDAIRPQEKLTAVVSLKNKRTSSEVPDNMLDTYGEYIAAGAVSRMAYMPERPWTSPQLADMMSVRFAKGVQIATRDGGAAGNTIVRQTKFAW